MEFAFYFFDLVWFQWAKIELDSSYHFQCYGYCFAIDWTEHNCSVDGKVIYLSYENARRRPTSKLCITCMNYSFLWPHDIDCSTCRCLRSSVEKSMTHGLIESIVKKKKKKNMGNFAFKIREKKIVRKLIVIKWSHGRLNHSVNHIRNYFYFFKIQRIVLDKNRSSTIMVHRF